ncbi:MAG: PQQ-like beta-propeller repeat protein [candidate division WOR-3 bacterium]|nr:MAG: PQQ-like beta-propeller repeat protein [candidate division WOR-3 bacterium]
MIEIVSPIDGSRVGDSVSVVIEVCDKSDIYYTDLYIDEIYVDRFYGEPDTYFWCTDSLQHLSEHTLYAEAVDAAFNTAGSDVISVTVVHPGTLKWTFQFERVYGCPAIGSDGTVYVTGTLSDNGYCYLFALNIDGTLKWQCHLGHDVYGLCSEPSIGPDGTIYVCAPMTNSPYIYLAAIHPTGAPLWEIEGVGRCPAIGSDGAVYVGSDDGLYVYEPNGELRWHYLLSGFAYSTAISMDGTIFFGCTDGNVYALNPDTTLKWTYSVELYGEIAIGSDNTIYFNSTDGHLCAVGSDGTLKWQYYSTYMVSPVIGFGGLIYTAGSVNGEGCYIALDPNGALVWSGPSGVWPNWRTACAVAADTTLYIASDNLYALGPGHQFNWSYELDMSANIPITVGDDGTVYVGTWSGRLYAISGLAPLAKADCSWPKVRHDDMNTGRGGY